MTNGESGNAVLSFRRAADGSLAPLGATPTGGRGTGGTIDPLMSQYSVLLTSDHAFLFVVNAGSDDISSFKVASDGTIAFANRVPSGGDQPVSLAVYSRILYALNKGNNTVSGFWINADGTLQPIAGSTRQLRSGAAGASTVAFTPDGLWLIVTEIMSNRLETFPLRADGRLGDPRITMSSGAGPFGFAVTPRNQPIVTEVKGAAPNGAVSSYRVAANGVLGAVTASLSTQQMATCWLVLTADGRYAFTANSASGSIAAFGVAENAALTLLDPRAGVSGPAGTMPPAAVPIDLDLSDGDRYLYVLEAGTGTIGTFAVGAGGTLGARADTPAGRPASGLQGLAAW
ncbi:MAG TPA: beta-propeller fold lactonase family protein [Gemmatimonadaceae bacterium]|nr:beta-propeller fold lactonase family protein [Gemmatimonadaceae bacterium]